MRIALGGIMHESNTFVALPTDLPAFSPRHHHGEAVVQQWQDTHHEVAGFIQGGRELGFDLVPTLLAWATPAGPVTADAFETLTGELTAAIREAPGLDGMLLACHGAMVSQEYPDADGEIIRRVREALGPDMPLVVTLDFHTNVSRKMVENATALVIYKTNPHLDQRQRGLQAAQLLARIVRGEVRPVQALAKPPMVWNILHQNTSAEPLRAIMADALQLEGRPGVLAANVAAGYPYADVEEMGPSVVVVTDGDEGLARREADRLAARMWDAREQIRIALPGPREAVERAVRSARPPVVVVEMGDNIGGGSPGDSTAILAELVRQDAPGAVSVIYDPEAAKACAAAGIGAEIGLQVGGKTDRLHGDPVAIRGRVRSLHDGRFYEPEARHGGATHWDQGLTAVVELPNGTLVVLDSVRTAPMSLHQLTSLGIRPERQRILVVKAAIAYRAAYEPVAGEIIEADTPGVTAVNPLRFEYRHARRPLWPLPPEKA
jgi:microcystin degradation protein MlrC